MSLLYKRKKSQYLNAYSEHGHLFKQVSLQKKKKHGQLHSHRILKIVPPQGDVNLAETPMKKCWKFEHFITSRTKWKVIL